MTSQATHILKKTSPPLPGETVGLYLSRPAGGQLFTNYWAFGEDPAPHDYTPIIVRTWRRVSNLDPETQTFDVDEYPGFQIWWELDPGLFPSDTIDVVETRIRVRAWFNVFEVDAQYDVPIPADLTYDSSPAWWAAYDFAQGPFPVSASLEVSVDSYNGNTHDRILGGPGSTKFVLASNTAILDNQPTAADLLYTVAGAGGLDGLDSLRVRLSPTFSINNTAPQYVINQFDETDAHNFDVVAIIESVTVEQVLTDQTIRPVARLVTNVGAHIVKDLTNPKVFPVGLIATVIGGLDNLGPSIRPESHVITVGQVITDGHIQPVTLGTVTRYGLPRLDDFNAASVYDIALRM